MNLAPHWALVPAKGFVRAKSRLVPALGDPLREVFAQGLLEHVLRTLLSVRELTGVLVLTDDDEVGAYASQFGCAVLRDPAQAAIGEVVDAGLRHAAQLGAEVAFVCMADLPWITADEVQSLLAEARQHDVVVVPDTREYGTNALCLTPPLALDGTCFGQGKSFEAHLQKAREAQRKVAVFRMRGLCFDVDDPDDLELC